MSILRQERYLTEGRIIGKGQIESALLFDRGKWTLYPFDESGIPQLNFDDLACDAAGNLWMYAPVESVLCRFDGRTAEVFHPGERGLPSDRWLLYAFAADMQGGWWIAITNGAYRFDGTTWQRFTLEQIGLTGEFLVARVSVDDTGRIWFVVTSDDYTSFLWYDEKRLEEYVRLPFGYKTDIANVLAMDKQGVLWVAWVEQGLWALDWADGQWKKYTDKNSALPDMLIQSMVLDKAGRVWVGTGEGIVTFDGTESVCWGAIIPDVLQGPLSQKEGRKAKERGDDRPYTFIQQYVIADTQGRIWARGGHSVAVFTEA